MIDVKNALRAAINQLAAGAPFTEKTASHLLLAALEEIEQLERREANFFAAPVAAGPFSASQGEWARVQALAALCTLVASGRGDAETRRIAHELAEQFVQLGKAPR